MERRELERKENKILLEKKRKEKACLRSKMSGI